jgi:hypothetical protein
VRARRDQHQRERHPETESAARQPPTGAQLAQREPAAIDEQDGEQGEIGQSADDAALRRDLDQPEHAGADERAATRNTSAVDSTDRAASPDSAIVTKRTTPNVSTRTTTAPRRNASATGGLHWS